MSHVRINRSTVEPIVVRVTDITGTFLTGLTDLYIRLVRVGDGFALDHADSTWKASGWTSLNGTALTELNATAIPGAYKFPGIDLSATTGWVDDADIIAVPIQTPGTNAVLPDSMEVKVGQWATYVRKNWVLHGAPGGAAGSALALVVDNAAGPSGTRKVPADGSEIDQTISVVGNVVTYTNN